MSISNNRRTRYQEYWARLGAADSFTWEDMVFSQLAAADSPLVVTPRTNTLTVGVTYNGQSQLAAVVTPQGGSFAVNASLPGAANTSGRFTFIMSGNTYLDAYIVEYSCTSTQQKVIWIRKITFFA